MPFPFMTNSWSVIRTSHAKNLISSYQKDHEIIMDSVLWYNKIYRVYPRKNIGISYL